MSEEKPASLPETPGTQHGETVIEEIIYEDAATGRSGCRGCVYGIGGAAGCFVILIALLVGAIAVARPAVEQVFDGFVNAVSGERVTRNLTLPIVERIQNLQELKTVRYNFSNIVQSSVDMPALLEGLYGDNIVLVAVGHIEAGIDLSQITPDDVTLVDDTLTVKLPAPQILSCFLDEQQTEVVERSRGVFAPSNVELDNAVRRFALRQFLNLALEDGILLDAATEGETTIRQLVSFALDDDSTIILEIILDESGMMPPLPDTCPRAS